MTRRARVLALLGGKCCWCGKTARLEIDHVHGDGAAHRATLKTSIETWVWNTYQDTGRIPTQLQLLCLDCHDRRSGRKRMPAKKGSSNVNIALQNHVLEHLNLMAVSAEYQGSKSRVIETLILHAIENQMSQHGTDHLHQHVSTIRADVNQALQTFDSTLQQLIEGMQKLAGIVQLCERRIASLEATQERQHNELVDVYRRAADSQVNPSRGLFSRR